MQNHHPALAPMGDTDRTLFAPQHKQRDQLLSRKDAAKYLNIAPQTLAVWACQRRNSLPLIKIGRHVKYRQSDLDAFIERNTHGSKLQ